MPENKVMLLNRLSIYQGRLDLPQEYHVLILNDALITTISPQNKSGPVPPTQTNSALCQGIANSLRLI